MIQNTHKTRIVNRRKVVKNPYVTKQLQIPYNAFEKNSKESLLQNSSKARKFEVKQTCGGGGESGGGEVGQRIILIRNRVYLKAASDDTNPNIILFTI